MNTEQNIDPKLKALSELVNDLGVDVLSDDKKNEFTLELTEAFLQRIFLETMGKLGEDGRQQYEKMSEGEIEPEHVEEFFREKIENYDKMVEDVIEKFKSEMMATNASH